MTWQAWTWTPELGEGERGAWVNFLTSTDLKRSCLSWKREGKDRAAAKIVDLDSQDSSNGCKKSSRKTLPVSATSCVRASRTCSVLGSCLFTRMLIELTFASLWKIVLCSPSNLFTKPFLVQYVMYCWKNKTEDLCYWSTTQVPFSLGIYLIVSLWFASAVKTFMYNNKIKEVFYENCAWPCDHDPE